MNKNTLTGLIVLTGIIACIVLLALAAVTRETKYLLAESAIIHFGILYGILSAFERSRRDG